MNDLSRKHLSAADEASRNRLGVISEGFECEGSIRFDGPLQLDGRFKGTMSVKSLTIGKTGDCEADLRCKSFPISDLKPSGSLAINSLQPEISAASINLS